MRNQGNSIKSKKVGFLSEMSSGYNQLGKVGGNRVPWMTSARKIQEFYFALENDDLFDLDNGDSLMVELQGV